MFGWLEVSRLVAIEEKATRIVYSMAALGTAPPYLATLHRIMGEP